MKTKVSSTSSSLIQKIDIRFRMLGFLFILPIAVVLADIPVLLALTFFLFLLLKFSGISFKLFWKNAKYYIVFSFISFLILSFFINKGYYLSRMFDGLILGTRFSVFLSFGMIYAFTTNPNEIPQAFAKMHIPHRFGILIMIGFRLYPLIVQKMTVVSEAIKSRGIDMKISILKPMQTVKIIKLMLPPFIIAAVETGTRLGDTMLSRGYHPYFPITISPKLSLKSTDWIWLAIIVGLLFCAILI